MVSYAKDTFGTNESLARLSQSRLRGALKSLLSPALCVVFLISSLLTQQRLANDMMTLSEAHDLGLCAPSPHGVSRPTPHRLARLELLPQHESSRTASAPLFALGTTHRLLPDVMPKSSPRSEQLCTRQIASTSVRERWNPVLHH